MKKLKIGCLLQIFNPRATVHCCSPLNTVMNIIHTYLKHNGNALFLNIYSNHQYYLAEDFNKNYTPHTQTL